MSQEHQSIFYRRIEVVRWPAKYVQNAKSSQKQHFDYTKTMFEGRWSKVTELTYFACQQFAVMWAKWLAIPQQAFGLTVPEKNTENDWWSRPGASSFSAKGPVSCCF